jgi:CBS domain-containing protein
VLEPTRDGHRPTTIRDLLRGDPIVAHPDETLRAAADRMALRGVGVLPVVERDNPARLCGVVSQLNLLRARERLLQEERHRERVIRVRRVPVA